MTRLACSHALLACLALAGCDRDDGSRKSTAAPRPTTQPAVSDAAIGSAFCNITGGMPAAEVEKLLGKPHKVDDNPMGGVSWSWDEGKWSFSVDLTDDKVFATWARDTGSQAGRVARVKGLLNSVRDGMSPGEVIGVLGQPWKRTLLDDEGNTVLIYNWTDDTGSVIVQFRNGVVEKTLTFP